MRTTGTEELEAITHDVPGVTNVVCSASQSSERPKIDHAITFGPEQGMLVPRWQVCGPDDLPRLSGGLQSLVVGRASCWDVCLAAGHAQATGVLQSFGNIQLGGVTQASPPTASRAGSISFSANAGLHQDLARERNPASRNLRKANAGSAPRL